MIGLIQNTYCRQNLVVLKLFDPSLNLFDEMHKILQDFLNRLLWDVIVLIQPLNGDIYAYTFYPYHAGNCRNAYPMLQGTFNTEIQRFTFIGGVNNLYSNKALDLKKCPLRVLAVINPPYTAQSYRNEFPISGIDVSIVKELSKTFNFGINVTTFSYQLLLDENERTGSWLEFEMV